MRIGLRLKVGSAPWLLRHEIRMFFYGLNLGTTKGAARRGLNKTSAAIWIALALVLHLFAYKLLDELESASRQQSPITIAIVSVVIAACFTFMLSTALRASVEALFERGDLDLLLSSPLSSRTIFLVRLLAIVVSVAGIYLFFLAPLAHMGAVLGQFHWLSIYPTVISLSLLAASIAMLLTLALVHQIGVRRTRTVAQILGAVSGALIFLVSQLFSSAGRQGWVTAHVAPLFEPHGTLGPDSLAMLPGRAMLGAPGAVLLLSAAAVLVFLFTVRFTHGVFARGVQQTQGGAAKPSQAGAPAWRFRAGVKRAVMLKEWRMIARDPQLISQVLLQLLYMVPLFVTLLARANSSLPAGGAAITFLCGSLTGALAWIIIAAEDAPDLLLAAPCAQTSILRAKLIAVVIPPLVLAVPPLLWLAFAHPVSALVMLALVCASVGSSAQIALWLGRPAQRSEFKHRAKGSIGANLLEAFSGFAWSGTAYLMLAALEGSQYSTIMLAAAAATFAVALVLLGVAWMFRRSGQ
jgi:ABC-2 type transport system permease protein